MEFALGETLLLLKAINEFDKFGDWPKLRTTKDYSLEFRSGKNKYLVKRIM